MPGPWAQDTMRILNVKKHAEPQKALEISCSCMYSVPNIILGTTDIILSDHLTTQYSAIAIQFSNILL